MSPALAGQFITGPAEKPSFSLRRPFNFSFIADLVVMNSFSFAYMENSLSYLFWVAIFLKEDAL